MMMDSWHWSCVDWLYVGTYLNWTEWLTDTDMIKTKQILHGQGASNERYLMSLLCAVFKLYL